MTTDPQTPISPSNRRALVHNAITDALSKAGDWVPLSVRIAATRAALAEVDAWHADEPAPAGLGVSATPSHTDQAAANREAAARAIQANRFPDSSWENQPESVRNDYRSVADAVLAVLPPPADRAAVLAEVLPDWEAVYEPGNVSDYLIGYANDQDAATGMAEAWMRSQAEVTGRLEWLSEERMATGRYDRWLELIERHDDGIDTGPGIIVRRRLADAASRPEPPVHGESVAHLAGLHDDEPDDTVHACPGRWGGPDCRCFDDEPAVDAQADGETSFVTRVLELFSLSHADAYGELFWRVDDGKVRLFANVSDVFAWGGSDCEPITSDTLPALEQDYLDLKAVDGEGYLATLYAARQRRQRPQGAAYPSGTDKAWREVSALYDACGPEKEIGLGNPKAAPAHEPAVDARQGGAQQ